MTPKDFPPIRIGVLGAARITRQALLAPIRVLPDMTVHAIAARDPQRAEAYAVRNHIARTHASYAELLADPDIDAVYIPLPAALHAEWTIAAIEAGKHVLCEKPFTSNASQAALVDRFATDRGVVVMEAYHSGHHPLLSRLREILESGELGQVMSARATFSVLIPPGRDIRWNALLGGGALLDVGYYPLRLLRDLFGEPEVLGAQALQRGDVDSVMTAQLSFAGGVRGEIETSMWPPRLSIPSLTVTGSLGTLRASMPYHPQTGGMIRMAVRGVRRSERADRSSTYLHQLKAFRSAVVGDTHPTTDAKAAVAQMKVIDAIYGAAGMSPRNL